MAVANTKLFLHSRRQVRQVQYAAHAMEVSKSVGNLEYFIENMKLLSKSPAICGYYCHLPLQLRAPSLAA